MAVAVTAVQAESRATTVIGAVSVMLAFTTALVGLRIYTRAVVLKTVGHDDWAIIVALIFTITCGVVIAGNTLNGLGRHVFTLKPQTIMTYMEAFYVSIVFYNASLTAVKISFLLQYYRVFTVRYMRRILLAALAIIGCWCLSQLLVVIFTCQPIAGFWDRSIPSTCIPNLPFWYINAAGNIVTDVAIFVLPLPVIRGLKLARAQKLVLVGIFSLGFFTCAISVIRIQYLRLTEDFTWDNVEPAIWSVAEPCCGVTCACLPTLRPLVAKFMPALSSRGGQSGATYGRYGTGTSSQGRTIDEEKVHTKGVASSKEQLYKTDSEAGGDEPWQRPALPEKAPGLSGTVATKIVADVRKPQPSLTKKRGQTIQIKREIRVVRDKDETEQF